VIGRGRSGDGVKRFSWSQGEKQKKFSLWVKGVSISLLGKGKHLGGR